MKAVSSFGQFSIDLIVEYSFCKSKPSKLIRASFQKMVVCRGALEMKQIESNDKNCWLTKNIDFPS